MKMICCLFIVSVLLLVRCGGDVYEPIVERVDSIIMADLDNFDRDDWSDGHYRVLEASITDDILKLRVELMESSEAEFDLVCFNYWMESAIPQAYAFLAYQESGDTKKIVTERELLFDLTPMKESFLETYSGGGAGRVVILKFRDSRHQQPDDAWLYYEF